MGKRVENLKENRKKGISMAIVLCVSAFFLAFAAAIVYTAGLLTAEANERLEQERCYQLAKSYAKVLDTELTSYNRKTEENSTTFYGFASRFLDGRYAEYDPGQSGQYGLLLPAGCRKYAGSEIWNYKDCPV